MSGGYARNCPECGRPRRPERDLVCPPCQELAATVAPDPDENAQEWAARVWGSWSPAERAEVAGAMSSLFESLTGGGQGAPASHRGRRQGSLGARRASLADDLAARSTSGRAPGSDLRAVA